MKRALTNRAPLSSPVGLVALVLSPFWLGAPFAAKGIPWDTEWEGAQARAHAENRVLFVACNMDGERANDRMAEDVYTEKKIAALSELTVNVIASAAEHKKGDKACPRFKGVTCNQHRKIDTAVRTNVLKPDAEGFVIAPQHVFLGPDGKVLLSVPYEVSADELEWCFVEAIRTVDPDADVRVSSKARPPKRLILGDVVDMGGLPGGGIRPLTRDEASELIDKVKRGGINWEERYDALRKIMTVDEEEAVDFIRQQLRAGASGGGRGGGGRGGGGRAAARATTDRRPLILHAIGVFSPASYWELIEEFADSGEDGMRIEAAVAFEQMATPDSLKTISVALRKERKIDVKGAWMRALGAAGAADKKARSTLLKAAKSDKEEFVQLAAIHALGYLTPGDDRDEALKGYLDSEEELVRAAAITAMGLSRDDAWLEILKE
ncbi:MAG: HEAT repeat domain-containing protein, partial [Planctomycetota bacterium]